MVKRQPSFVNTPAQTTPGGSTSSTTRHFTLSILQSVPRSRELIQSCSPSHASACGVTVGDSNLFRSLIAGSFIVTEQYLPSSAVFYFLFLTSYFLLSQVHTPEDRIFI